MFECLKAWMLVLKRIQNDEVSDTTDAQSSTKAKCIKNKN